jgi:hypothetical protein
VLEQNGLTKAFESGLSDVYFNPAAKPHAFSVNWPGTAVEARIPTTLPDGYERVAITRYRHTSVELIGEVGVPSLVILTDTWHKNWSAQVDGKPAPIERVNSVFRGVRVPAGQFTIQMSYRPASLTTGIVVSLIALFVLLGFLGMAVATSRRRLLMHNVNKDSEAAAR